MHPRKLTTLLKDEAAQAIVGTDAPEGLDASVLQHVPVGITVSDPTQDDNPLIFANQAFLKLTGYAEEDVLGRNCRFLQGDLRDQPGLATLRAAIADGQETTVDLINVRADGSHFVNRVMVAPLYWDNGDLAYFLGIQIKMSDGADAGEPDADDLSAVEARLAELQHRVKNHLALVVGMIRREARAAPNDQKRLDIFATRVEALSMLYDQVDGKGLPDDSVRLDAYLGRLCGTLGDLAPSPGIAVTFFADPATLPIEEASQLGMLLSELLSNAFKHGFPDRPEGRVEVTLLETEGTLVLTVEDDGVGLDAPFEDSHGLGARIVRGLCERLDATLDVASNGTGQGTAIRVVIPVPADQDGSGGDR